MPVLVPGIQTQAKNEVSNDDFQGKNALLTVPIHLALYQTMLRLNGITQNSSGEKVKKKAFFFLYFCYRCQKYFFSHQETLLHLKIINK